MGNVTVDIARGRSALIYFHNEALQYPQNYPFKTFQQLLDKLNADSPTLIQTIGAAIPDSHLSESEIQAGMEAMADDGQGRLPRRYADFMNFLVAGSYAHISFADALVGGVSDTAKQLAQSGVKIGEAAAGGVTNTLTILPIIAFSAVMLFVFLNSKKI